MIDGTGIRDYRHLVDSVKEHIKTIKNLKSDFNVYNLGTIGGNAVTGLVKTFIMKNEVDIPYNIV